MTTEYSSAFEQKVNWDVELYQLIRIFNIDIPIEHRSSDVYKKLLVGILF